MSNSAQQLNKRTIRVDALARVEGEGALHLTMHEGKVAEARLQIFEPPRFYEGFLKGRDYREVPDITARICGICPVAHQTAACQALENALQHYNLEILETPLSPNRLFELLHQKESEK